MTDYRTRNHDLLYADRGRKPLTWRHAAIFGTIAVTVTVGVASYLTDRFNPATAGFNPAPARMIAQDNPTATPVIHLARPESARSGS
jgi:hypothetical protein